MASVACDTNVLPDYFLQRERYKKAGEPLSKTADGLAALYIPLLVILEFERVLRQYYNVEKPIVIDLIKSILELPNCEVQDRKLAQAALALFQEQASVNLDDCIIALTALDRHVEDFATSDKKLHRLYKSLAG